MALSERSIISAINVTAVNTVEVRQSNQILRDGEVISENYHRWTLNPWDDISTQDPKVQAICNAAWEGVDKTPPAPPIQAGQN